MTGFSQVLGFCANPVARVAVFASIVFISGVVLLCFSTIYLLQLVDARAVGPRLPGVKQIGARPLAS